MTYEEVIKQIEWIVDVRCEEYLAYLAHSGRTDEMFEKEMETFDIAIKCINKQMPKKPILEADGYADGELVYDTWYCPNCGKSYEVDYDSYDFCPNCGQSIDWRDK